MTIGVFDFKSRTMDKFKKFNQNLENSDVFLRIGDDRIPAHRFILAAHSNVFHKLLSVEPRKDVTISAPLDAFKILLAYMYSGVLDIQETPYTDITALLQLTHKYGFTELKESIGDFLAYKVDSENVAVLLDLAKIMSLEKLQKSCLRLIEMIIEGVYGSEKYLTPEILIEFLMDDTRMISEVKLFELIAANVKRYKTVELERILASIKLTKMTATQLVEVVRPTKLFKDSMLMDVIASQSLLRASKIENINLAQSVFFGILNPGVLQHRIGDGGGAGVVVDLTAMYVINYVKFSFKLDMNYKAGYYVEVSVNKVEWTKVVDYSDSLCSGDQNLFFPEIVGQYIKVVGTCSESYWNDRTTGNDWFEIKHGSMHAGYVAAPPKFCCGYVMPEHNIAIGGKAYANTAKPGKIWVYSSILDGGSVISGLTTPFAAAALKDESIVIIFGQPYLLNLCHFRLWDFDGRKYAYTVEVTADDKVFEIICDKSLELVGGNQTIKFRPRPVLRFRVKGVNCTAGNELRIACFMAGFTNIDPR